MFGLRKCYSFALSLCKQSSYSDNNKTLHNCHYVSILCPLMVNRRLISATFLSRQCRPLQGQLLRHRNESKEDGSASLPFLGGIADVYEGVSNLEECDLHSVDLIDRYRSHCVVKMVYGVFCNRKRECRVRKNGCEGMRSSIGYEDRNATSVDGIEGS